jgi:hypothetical protein
MSICLFSQFSEVTTVAGEGKGSSYSQPVGRNNNADLRPIWRAPAFRGFTRMYIYSYKRTFQQTAEPKCYSINKKNILHRVMCIKYIVLTDFFRFKFIVILLSGLAY